MSLILHLGAPKTATSTLQNSFFPKLPGLLFLGKEVDSAKGRTGWRTPEIEALMLALERTNYEFKASDHDAARLVAGIREEAGSRPVVISSEDLCLFTGIDSLKKIERIERIFGALGPIKIALAVREQVSLLKSIYITEHRGEMLNIAGSKQGWYPSFDQYLDIHFRYLWGAVAESFRFNSMLKQYERLVGRERIFVYAFSEFQRDPESILAKFSDFLGVDADKSTLGKAANKRENQHYSARSYSFIKIRPYFAPIRRLVPAAIKDGFYRWVGEGKPFDFAPSPAAVQRIKEYYQVDNDALHANYGIRL